MSCIPIVGETSGGWGTSAICTFKSLSKAASLGDSDEQGKVLHNHLQRIGAAIRRANARGVLRRRPEDSPCYKAVQSALHMLAARLNGDTERWETEIATFELLRS